MNRLSIQIEISAANCIKGDMIKLNFQMDGEEDLGKHSFKKIRNFMKTFHKRGGGGSTGFHISYSELYMYSEIRSQSSE